jgi:hypothetical protein
MKKGTTMSARSLCVRLLVISLIAVSGTFVTAQSFHRSSTPGVASPPPALSLAGVLDRPSLTNGSPPAPPFGSVEVRQSERFLNLLIRRETALLKVQLQDVRQLTVLASRLNRISVLVSRTSIGKARLYGLALPYDLKAYSEILRFNRDVRNSRAVLSRELLVLRRLARLEPGNLELTRFQRIIALQGRVGNALGRPPISQPIPGFILPQ